MSEPGSEVSRFSPTAEFREGWHRLRRLTQSPLARDHAVTFATEVVGLCSALLVLRIAARYWGASGFGEFVLGRRAMGFIQLPVLLGLGLALTRTVAMAHGSNDREREWGYLDAAVALSVITSALTGGLLLGLAPWLAVVAFGDAGLAPLTRAMAPCVAGLVLHTIAYGFLRGRRTMVPANLLQVTNMALLPLLVLLLPDLSVAGMFTSLGCAWLAISVLVLLGLRQRGPRFSGRGPLWRGPARELLRYGAPRVPGEFMLGALTMAPVAIAAHLGGKVEAGQIGLGLSLLSLLGSLFNPLAQVMLPHLSARLAAGRVRDLPRLILIIAGTCIVIGLLACLVLEAAVSWLLPRFLGPEFVSAVMPVRIILLGTVPYVAYIVLRTVLDAIHAAPLNTGNLFAALATLGLIVLLFPTPGAVPYAVLAATLVLGLLSVWRTRRVLAGVTLVSAE